MCCRLYSLCIWIWSLIARDIFRTLTEHYITTNSDKKLWYTMEGILWNLSYFNCSTRPSPSTTAFPIHPPQPGKCLYAWSRIKTPVRDVPILTVATSMFATTASMSSSSPTTAIRLSIALTKKRNRPNQQGNSVVFRGQTNLNIFSQPLTYTPFLYISLSNYIILMTILAYKQWCKL